MTSTILDAVLLLKQFSVAAIGDVFRSLQIFGK